MRFITVSFTFRVVVGFPSLAEDNNLTLFGGQQSSLFPRTIAEVYGLNASRNDGTWLLIRQPDCAEARDVNHCYI